MKNMMKHVYNLHKTGQITNISDMRKHFIGFYAYLNAAHKIQHTHVEIHDGIFI